MNGRKLRQLTFSAISPIALQASSFSSIKAFSTAYLEKRSCEGHVKIM
jgi:hypothetical protein